MEKTFSRSQRVAQEIQRNLAIILQCKMKDPRIGMATVSGVKISRDLIYAKVYITFLNLLVKNYDKKLVINRIKVLQNAASYIQILLGKTMNLRVVPKLTFSYDNSIVEGMRISDLVTKTLIKDIERHCKSQVL